MKEMKDLLESHLLKINDEPEEDTEDKRNNTKIKTYIIESNIDNPKKIKTLPENSLLKETNDNNLYQLNFNQNIGSGQIFLDISDKRYWILHSIGESNKIQKYIQKLVTSNESHLDYSWFSSNFLEEKCAIGTGEGFNIKYKNSFLDEQNDEMVKRSLKSFTMLFWGTQPSEVISGLKENSTLASGVSLSRIKQLVKTDDGFVKENIGREGKFTLWKGDSIDSHLWAVEDIKSKYSDLISIFENEYRIQYKPTNSGYNIQGTYSRIIFNKKIQNMDFFLKRFLSGNDPFRIFGIPQKISETYYKIAAVDLHTYDKFNMEITPDFIRIYLYKNSCGNVITRLMTNLQQFYDSQVEIRGMDNEKLL